MLALSIITPCGGATPGMAQLGGWMEHESLPPRSWPVIYAGARAEGGGEREGGGGWGAAVGYCAGGLQPPPGPIWSAPRSPCASPTRRLCRRWTGAGGGWGAIPKSGSHGLLLGDLRLMYMFTASSYVHLHNRPTSSNSQYKSSMQSPPKLLKRPFGSVSPSFGVAGPRCHGPPPGRLQSQLYLAIESDPER